MQSTLRSVPGRLLATHVILVTALSCGPAVIPLPTPLEAGGPPGTPDHQVSASSIHHVFKDRGLGRSGFACSDCHGGVSTHDGRIYAGPSFRVGQAPRGEKEVASDMGAAIAYCVERYLMRSPLPKKLLSAFLRSLRPVVTAPTGTREQSGRALFVRACVHCHDNGPGQRLLGLALRRGALHTKIRGPGISHPQSLMPIFSTRALSNAEVALIVEFLLYGDAGQRGGRPGIPADLSGGSKPGEGGGRDSQ